MSPGEFSYNNSMISADRIIPFYPNYGYHPFAGTAPTETNMLSVSSEPYGYYILAVFEDCKKEL
jgi:hypothetical protein